MALVTGTAGNDIIAPDPISRTPTTPRPTAAADVINALAGNDVVTGGGGADRIDLGDGDDLALWRSGDGSDRVNGEAGFDTLALDLGTAEFRVELDRAGSIAQLALERADDRIVTLNLERITIDADSTAASIVVSDLSGTAVREVVVALGGAGSPNQLVGVLGTQGADTIAVTGNSASLMATGLSSSVEVTGAEASDTLVVDGLAGNDRIDLSGLAEGPLAVRIEGSGGDDAIIGHAGADQVRGGTGSDVAQMGAGDDRFTFVGSDGSDTVDGGAGSDTIAYFGSGASEIIDLVAVGAGARFTTDTGLSRVDLAQVERLELAMSVGRDAVLVGDLSGSGITDVAVSFIADGVGQASDFVTFSGRAGADFVSLAGTAGKVSITGLGHGASAAGLDGEDRVSVSGGAGNDTLDARKVAAGVATIGLAGGDGDDTLRGSAGSDELVGGNGADRLVGGGGTDAAFLGAGDDRYIATEAGGTAIVLGEAGFDVAEMRLANEPLVQLRLGASGTHALIKEATGRSVIDAQGIEQAEIIGGTGSHRINVDDLSGTELREVLVSLKPGAGTLGDAVDDQVTVRGSAVGEHVVVANGAGAVNVLGLAASVRVTGFEATNDRLAVDAGAGNDTIDASILAPGSVVLAINGGLGDDLVVGHAGIDQVSGGAGNDNVRLGAGDDVFSWVPGDGIDMVAGEAGFDAARLVGNGTGESFTLKLAADSVEFTRGLGSERVTMTGIESIVLTANDGGDTVTLNDLASAGVEQVTLEMGDREPDGAFDRAFLNAGAQAEIVRVSGDAAAVLVQGMGAEVTMLNLDGTDQVTVNLAAGNDTLDATTLAAGSAVLRVLGGDGNDVLAGGLGADSLAGDAGNDTLLGGGGDDLMGGGDGNDLLVGGQGSDRLLGGAGLDVFRFSPPDGTDRITDFQAGSDRIELLGFGQGLQSFAELQAVMAQVGANVQIDLGANVDQGGLLILQTVSIAQLSAADFLFG